MPFIREAALELILGASRELRSREFIGLLRGEGDTITEVLVIPASLYGEGFAHMKWSMVPLDRTIVGSVHSHPSGDNRPSERDLIHFKKTGRIHLIVRQPAEGIEDVACYDRDGGLLALETVD
jgi:proteasome lid subunit RPN8/RPN11